MKILYICKDYSKLSDGGSIYDYKMIQAIKNHHYSIHIHKVKLNKNISLPLWKKKIDLEDINKIIDLSKKYDKTIVSHESLSSICKYITPDLYIFHNVFSYFSSNNLILNFLYKLGSTYEEKKIIYASKNILVLSERENTYLTQKYTNQNFICEPPGIKNNHVNKNIYLLKEKLKLMGSKDWLPKKITSLTNREIKSLNYFFEIDYTENKNSSFALIDEKFLVGFKLKLIEMLFNGDIIFSRSNLENEIKHLGLKNYNYKFINTIKEINNDIINSYISKYDYKTVLDTQKYLIKNYSWLAISARILTKIDCKVTK